jgi:hypothetical protein
MRLSGYDGQIAYDLGEFCKDYGHAGPVVHLRSHCDAVTYAYANVVRTVHARNVIFELSREDLVCTRKAH